MTTVHVLDPSDPLCLKACIKLTLDHLSEHGSAKWITGESSLLKEAVVNHSMLDGTANGVILYTKNSEDDSEIQSILHLNIMDTEPTSRESRIRALRNAVSGTLKRDVPTTQLSRSCFTKEELSAIETLTKRGNAFWAAYQQAGDAAALNRFISRRVQSVVLAGFAVNTSLPNHGEEHAKAVVESALSIVDTLGCSAYVALEDTRYGIDSPTRAATQQLCDLYHANNFVEVGSITGLAVDDGDEGVLRPVTCTAFVRLARHS